MIVIEKGSQQLLIYTLNAKSNIKISMFSFSNLKEKIFPKPATKELSRELRKLAKALIIPM